MCHFKVLLFLNFEVEAVNATWLTSSLTPHTLGYPDQQRVTSTIVYCVYLQVLRYVCGCVDLRVNVDGNYNVVLILDAIDNSGDRKYKVIDAICAISLVTITGDVRSTPWYRSN